MQVFTAYAAFTETNIIISLTDADITIESYTATINALDLNGGVINDSLLMQLLTNRRTSYRFCEGTNWQSLSGVGTTEDKALRELRKCMIEWLPSWVSNYVDVANDVMTYLTVNRPTNYTDVTADIVLTRKT